MTHRLDVVVQVSMANELVRFRVDFADGFESEVHALVERTSAFPDSWPSTSYSTASERIAWQERGSRDRLSAVLSGCLQHGWPFVAYAAARTQDEPGELLQDYDHCYLGWWASRQSFAEEVAAAGGHFMAEGEQLDAESIDEICSGFLCLDIDGQVLVFDLMLQA